VKQRRRALLKGFRAGLWTGLDRPSEADVAANLRAEVFGHKLPTASAEVDESERVTTLDQDAQWLVAMESRPVSVPEEDERVNMDDQ